MITKNKLQQYCGLSTDDKNSIKDASAIFHEMDTDKYYARTIDNWKNLPKEYTQVKYLSANSTTPYIDTEWQDITNVINKDWKHIPPDPVLPKITPILPEGYAECEYVYTDGTALATRAIIDTGYAYEDPDGIRIVSTYKVCTTDTNDGYPAFGVDFFRTGSTRQMHGHMWKNGLYLGEGKVAEANSYYLNTKITLDFTFENNTATWVITDHDNNTTETKTYEGNNGWVGSQDTDYLGALHKNANDDDIYLKGNIYRHTMYHHGEKVRDFVPCLRLEDSIPGMYELVTGTFCRGNVY